MPCASVYSHAGHMATEASLAKSDSLSQEMAMISAPYSQKWLDGEFLPFIMTLHKNMSIGRTHIQIHAPCESLDLGLDC